MADEKQVPVVPKEYETNETTMPAELVDAMLSIGEMTDGIVRAIPEADFRNKYLPMFTSTAKNVDLSPWLDISGTAYESVNVVKNGQVIFVVPPLVKRHPTLINVQSHKSSHTIMIEARQYHDRHPALGQRHIIDNLGEKIVKEGVDLDEVRQWNAILEYYGFEPIGGLKSEKIEEPKAAEFKDDDFEEM